ncbi:ferredoxin [Aeromicrobium sp. YIM 150415]|uniref:ferredoxin n=1 Tax=Aeromicrobium sp. YIM 150415 TaxID=2803912 RepID=UPI001964CA7E|nr:ferredoxin [Aeromicrobium sp. YIM 150415]MBM9465590.1 ferredoxin [Aeromicrobium sp. YIM 150415]
MFIEIDGAKCMGHGRCYAVAPDLLSDDDEGFVAERGTSWEVPADLLDQAQEAADACPEGAIVVTATAPADA